MSILGESQGYLCSSCLESIKPYHTVVYEPIPYVTSYKVFTLYEGATAEALRLLKFKRVKPLAEFLGKCISEDLLNFRKSVGADYLTFVPVHFFRKWKRGFDHNEEILKACEGTFQYLILRRKNSKPLYLYGKEERFRRVAGAFYIPESVRSSVKGKDILVFDDILTTGATASSVANTLLSSGVNRVYFYFLCREK